jgi:predicted HTH domain antitoxin
MRAQFDHRVQATSKLRVACTEKPTLDKHVDTLEGWELDQLVKLREQQPELVESAVYRLIQDNDEIRWSLAVGAYREGQVNLGKAAELLGLTELELRARFIELGIPLRIGPADLAEARAEVEAVRAWSKDRS